MSTILRSLNGTSKKKRTLAPSNSSASKNIQQPNAPLLSAGRKRGVSTDLSGIKPLHEAEEGDEVSNI